MRLDIGIAGIQEIEKWLPRDEESTARERLRQLAADRDEAWRRYGRLEEQLQRAIATLEYMGGAELVVEELRQGNMYEPSDAVVSTPMRYCLNVHGEMLCDGPQHHEGGCRFTFGWELVRRIEDDLVSLVGYAGDTTNELREMRDVLHQIAASKRPDGTYNLSREACEQLARKALDGTYTDSKTSRSSMHWAIRLRLRLLLNRPSRWNAWVRDLTARLERGI